MSSKSTKAGQQMQVFRTAEGGFFTAETKRHGEEKVNEENIYRRDAETQRGQKAEFSRDAESAQRSEVYPKSRDRKGAIIYHGDTEATEKKRKYRN
ncbi:MAG TPA: hypothetical protein VMJ32_11760 [Pirellulales bacterium]|nr:hypothetical protein [Pirellulales bacterium]